MTQLVVHCPQCGQQYQIAQASAGRRFQCQQCSSIFVAGAASPPAYGPALTPPGGFSPSGYDPLASAQPLRETAQKPNSSSGLSKPLMFAAAGAGALVAFLVIGLIVFSGFSGEPDPVGIAPAASMPSSPPVAPPPGPPSIPQPPSTQALAASASPSAAPGTPPVPPVPAPIASTSATTTSPSDPAVLTAELIEQSEEQIRLVSSVSSIESAKAVADRYPAVTQRVYRLEAQLRNRLVPEEQQQQLDRQFKDRLDAIRTKWAAEFMRVTAIPGAFEHMDPELAPYADMTLIPTDVDGLHREALRALGNALEASRQVQSIETAKKFSAPYRVGNARAAQAVARLRRELKLGLNGRNSPEIVALGRQQDEELKRIGKIPGAHALFSRGETGQSAAASAPAAGVKTATMPRPPETESFFAQNPQAVVVRFSEVRDNADHEPLHRLVMLSSPPMQQLHGMGNGNLVMSPVTDLEELLTRFDFATVTVDRNSRVILLTPRYPLPDLSAVAARSLTTELQSGDQLRVRHALSELTNIKPGAGREVIGAELLKLISLEPVRGQAVDALKRGWFSHEQIPLVQQALPSIQDEGLRQQMVVGISKLPDLDPKTIGWISSFYPTEHHAVMECWRNIGPPVEPHVHEFLSHPKHEKRKDAAKTLGYIGTKASLPLLEKMLNDDDRGVAEEAKKAIAEINKPDNQRDWYQRQRE